MERSGNLLLSWSVAALAADLIHDLDHVRRSNYSPVPVRVLGFLALAGGILAIVLAARRNRSAALYTAFYGFAGAIGLVVVHVLPHWSVFSDPFTSYRVDALSWAIVALDVVVSAGLGVVATREMLRTRNATARVERAPSALPAR
jgi:hypothetical protein